MAFLVTRITARLGTPLSEIFHFASGPSCSTIGWKASRTSSSVMSSSSARTAWRVKNHLLSGSEKKWASVIQAPIPVRKDDRCETMPVESGQPSVRMYWRSWGPASVGPTVNGSFPGF